MKTKLSYYLAPLAVAMALFAAPAAHAGAGGIAWKVIKEVLKPTKITDSTLDGKAHKDYMRDKGKKK